MAFHSYLEKEKPEHIVLLDYVKLFETIKDKESDLSYLQVKREEAEAELANLQSTYE